MELAQDKCPMASFDISGIKSFFSCDVSYTLQQDVFKPSCKVMIGLCNLNLCIDNQIHVICIFYCQTHQDINTFFQPDRRYYMDTDRREEAKTRCCRTYPKKQPVNSEFQFCSVIVRLNLQPNHYFETVLNMSPYVRVCLLNLEILF